jgi:hypothetical protein
MPTIKVAHLREQGQDMIITPLERSFGYQPHSDQLEAVREIQLRANDAGLRGKVVAFWETGFIAPNPWHPFVRSLSLQTVWANVNKEISWYNIPERAHFLS